MRLWAPTGSSDAPRAETAKRRLLMARAGAALLLSAGAIVTTATLTGDGLDGRGAVAVAAAVGAALLAALVYFRHEQLGARGTHGVAAGGAVLITAVVAAERPGYALLYVWLAFFVAAFFRPRAVVLHLAWILACGAVALRLGDPQERPFESWLLLTGTLVGVVVFAFAVRRHLSDLAVRERRARAVLDTVFATAPVGLALFDRELRYARVNETLARWSGMPAEAHVGRRVDEVVPGLGEQVDPHLREVLEGGEPVLAIETRQGDRVYRVSRYPVRDADGTITLIASIVDDVTEETRAQQQLGEALAGERETRAFLDQLFEHAPVDLAFVDTELVYRHINRRALESSGRSASDIIGHTVAEAYPELAHETEPELRRILETGVPVVGRHVRTESPPGSGVERHWLVSRYPLRNDEGRVLGVTSMRTDVTALKRAEGRLAELLASEQQARAELEETWRILEERNRELAAQAQIDSLTGLANRAAFATRLDAQLEAAAASGTGVGVVCLDLDGFKQINDTLGHAAGDEALRAVSQRLGSVARETDTAARLGGDEFLVLLADLDPARAPELAAAVGERIRAALEEPIAVAGRTTRVRASVGVASYPADASEADALVAAADAAMYRAKKAARRGRRRLRTVGAD